MKKFIIYLILPFVFFGCVLKTKEFKKSNVVKSIEVFNKLDIHILGYVENNISNKKISYDFKLLDDLDLKKLVSISFCDEIYEFNPKKTHDSIKDLSSLI